MDDPAPNLGQACHLTYPVGRYLFDFGDGRTGLPRKAKHTESGVDEIPKHASGQGIGRKIAEESPVLPMRQAWHNQSVQISQDRLKGLRLLGWISWKAGGNFTRADRRLSKPS